jgi:CDGSH-type Zn-finger protein
MATIEIRANGPYVVLGGLPLVRTSQVETEYGEPVDWAPDEPIDVGDTHEPVEAGETYELCRCGASTRKPFCDAVHERNGFDGTEVADRGTFADRAYPYRGEGVTMHDDRTLCTSAGYCGDRFTNVWAMIERTADPEIRDRLRRMSMLCPSGRLVSQPDGDEPDEIDYAPSVAVTRDGPLWVRGGVEIAGADGEIYETRNRVTLCRCGHSQNKPFCDGSHKDVGFRDG